MAEDSFLARWAHRKERARGGAEALPEPVPRPVVAPAPTAPAAAAPDTPPPPTMDDVALLTRESDYARFVGAGVDPGVKRAALKKLFSDPRFNVMDGLDTYIDDYGRPDPIPLAMLRQMNQSKFLGLFDAQETGDEPADEVQGAAGPAVPSAAPTEEPRHDDPDLRLQQDDGAGRRGSGEGAGA